jgi:hypothetical protein
MAEPAFVDHQHALGETVGADAAGVGEDVLLVLVVSEFDPGVVLRMEEERVMGCLACGGEEALADVAVSVPQRFSVCAGEDSCGL